MIIRPKSITSRMVTFKPVIGFGTHEAAIAYQATQTKLNSIDGKNRREEALKLVTYLGEFGTLDKLKSLDDSIPVIMNRLMGGACLSGLIEFIDNTGILEAQGNLDASSMQARRNDTTIAIAMVGTMRDFYPITEEQAPHVDAILSQ